MYPMPVVTDYWLSIIGRWCFEVAKMLALLGKTHSGGGSGRILDPRDSDLRVAGIAMIRAKATDNLR